LDGVTATGNLNSGVEIQDGGTTATFTNGTYSSNGGDGINVASLATTLTVSGVTASNNAGDGLVISDGGTMAFLSGVFSNNASGRGVNLASDTIFVNGSLDSGTGAIVLTAPSGVFFTASAVLNVDLGGTSAGAFTTVTISDAVTLDGTLNAELVNGFTPVAGDRFRFMTFDSRTGFFAATNLPERFSVDQSDPTDLELVFNLPPDFVEVADRTVEEGHELRFTVTATDDDPQSSLVFSASGLPAGATFNPTTREFSWVPADDAVATVTFLVTDPHGATDTMEVKVTATNVAPTVDAGADQVVGLQKIDDHDKDEKHGKDKDKPEAEVSITAVFDDLGLRDTHTATINWGDGSATAVGKVIEPTATADGAVTGKHTYTRAGTYTVTVTVRDDDGGVRSDTLLITVKQPVEKKNFDAKGDEYRLNEDAVLTVNAAHGVLDNDRSPAGVTLKARVVEGPEHGKLLFSADGSFTYVPDQDFHGKDSFWYEFTDGSNVSKAVEVKLDVKEVKDRHPRPCIDWDGDWKTPGSDSFMPFGKHWR
jgi:PKD repeat protein